MAQTFPASLQDKVNQAGFSNQFGDTLIRSNVDIGFAKVRSRYTKGIDVFSVTITINKSDYTTVENFFKTTLKGGSLTFNYDHPFTEVETEFRFVEPPKITPIGGKYFTVTMKWEEVPA